MRLPDDVPPLHETREIERLEDTVWGFKLGGGAFSATPRAIDELRPRQLECAVLLSSGLSVAETAAELNLGTSAVSAHLHNLYEAIDAGKHTAILAACLSHEPQILELTDTADDAYADALTRRELDVAIGIGDGKPYKELSDELEISVDTVKAHVTKMVRAVGAGSVSEVVAVILASPDVLAGHAAQKASEDAPIDPLELYKGNDPRTWYL